MYIPLSCFLKTILYAKELVYFGEMADFKASAEKVQEDELRTSHHARR